MEIRLNRYLNALRIGNSLRDVYSLGGQHQGSAPRQRGAQSVNGPRLPGQFRVVISGSNLDRHTVIQERPVTPGQADRVWQKRLSVD